MTKNKKNEFVVHHEKLVEYGIMTSTQSTHVREKLKCLSLVEGEDYLLADVGESRLSQHDGSNGNKKVYYLTPGAFKICLMRAQRKLLFL